MTSGARISLARRQQILTLLVAVAAIAFPLVHDNDADIDSAGERRGLCHAGAGSQHRRRVRRPARPWLRGVLRHRRLYLRHPDLVPGDAALGTVLGAVRVAGTGAAHPEPRRRPGAFHRVVLDHAAGVGTDRSRLRRAVRRPHPAPARRLSGDRHTRVWGDRADRRAQRRFLTNGAAGLNGIQAPQLFGHSFGVAAWPYYYVAIAWWRC